MIMKNEIDVALDAMREAGRILSSTNVDNTIETAQEILIGGIKEIKHRQLTREIVKEEIAKQFGEP